MDEQSTWPHSPSVLDPNARLAAPEVVELWSEDSSVVGILPSAPHAVCEEFRYEVSSLGQSLELRKLVGDQALCVVVSAAAAAKHALWQLDGKVDWIVREYVVSGRSSPGVEGSVE